MAGPVHVRRLTDQEGQKLQQVVRRGSTGPVLPAGDDAVDVRRREPCSGDRPAGPSQGQSQPLASCFQGSCIGPGKSLTGWLTGLIAR